MAVTTAARGGGRAATSNGRLLVITSLAPLLVLMDYSTPLILVPQTADHLGAGASGQTWIMSGISLGLAALLLVGGGIADDYGRRRVFVVGAAVLSASSVAGALAPDTLAFVLARIVQGMAGAALLVASLGIMGHAFPSGPARLRATGLYGSMLGAGVAAGPLLGGALERPLGWNAAYWIYAAGAALLAVAAQRMLQESKAEHPRRLDLAGVLTLGTGLAALLAAITEGRGGWADPAVIILFAAAAALLAAFVAIELRARQPLLDLELFRRPAFLVATGGALVQGVAVIGLMSDLSTVLQHQQDFSPLRTAAIIAYWSAVSFVASLQARRVRLRPGALLGAGFAFTAAGYLLLLGLAAHWSWPRAGAALLAAGIGYGVANSALTRLSIDSVPADRASMGSGANNTARYVGSAIGVPIVVAVVAAAGFDAALWTCAALLLVAFIPPVLLRT